jgi:UDP-2-acetamido-3-amino-2,3-dideoxy-glucuronate N-acetyltransferase
MSTEKEYFCHESAIIDQGAQIGAGTKVWHFSHVMGDSKLGEN